MLPVRTRDQLAVERADRGLDHGVARGNAHLAARPAGARAKGRVREALRGGRKGRLHARARGRRDEGAAREDRSRQEAQAHDRGDRRPARDETGGAQASRGFDRDDPSAFQRHRDGDRRAGRRIGRREARADVQRGVRMRLLRPLVRRARAAAVLVQLAVRCVPGLQRAGRKDRDRSVDGDPRPEQVHRRRRDRAVEPQLGRRTLSVDESVLQSAARARAAQPSREDDDADRAALRRRARRHPLRYRSRAGVRVHVARREDVGVSRDVRGRREQPAAPLRRNVERVREGRDREVHVGLGLPRLQGRPPQARGACGDRRRPQRGRAHAHVDRTTRNILRGPDADRAPGADRASNRQRDSRAPGLSYQRRPELSHAFALRDDACGRGVPTDSPCDADR